MSHLQVAWGPMSFQVHHGRRRGSTRAVTAPAFPPDPRPSTAAAQPRETVATAHGGSRDEPLRRPAAFGGSSSVGSLNNQLRAMRATAPSRRSHRDVLLAPLPPLPPRPRLPPRGTLLDQLAQCQANADSLIRGRGRVRVRVRIREQLLRELVEQRAAWCQANADSLISDMHS